MVEQSIVYVGMGNCLKHYIAIWDFIVSFFADTQLGAKLLSTKCDVFHLSDIFENFNLLNKQLQENNSDLISSKSAITAYIRKLQLYKNNIRHCAFEQFPCLASINSDLQDEDLALYGEYLENIHEDMQTWVGNLLGMDILIWVSIPFEVNIAEIDISLQKSLNKIQSDEIMHAQFKDEKYNIWKTNDVAAKYSLLWEKVQFYIIAFPTSYLVEADFSRNFSQMLSKDCNRLDIVKRDDFQQSLASIEPNIYINYSRRINHRDLIE
ncbi:hypothetical protein QYM36_008359 [Artemia franciscana]|uniref:Uncharacterized protein n=1 Tax=Artemia franciscana TaxID=6661 RepID=A0AA88IGP8_ARTSF|nr:hypothetical protein QYM36_008359 [Artemia franciscana]